MVYICFVIWRLLLNVCRTRKLQGILGYALCSKRGCCFGFATFKCSQELMPDVLLFQGLKGTAKALQDDSVANLTMIQC